MSSGAFVCDMKRARAKRGKRRTWLCEHERNGRGGRATFALRRELLCLWLLRVAFSVLEKIRKHVANRLPQKKRQAIQVRSAETESLKLFPSGAFPANRITDVAQWSILLKKSSVQVLAVPGGIGNVHPAVSDCL
jgi:hypothetical protein